MILLAHRATYIRVMRLRGVDFAQVDDCGKFFRTTRREPGGVTGRTEWIWDGHYRNMGVGYETFTNCEKRAIIGLLDDLNGIRYRSQNSFRTRWNEIIGRKLVDLLADGPKIGPLSDDGIEGLDDNNPWPGKF